MCEICRYSKELIYMKCYLYIFNNSTFNSKQITKKLKDYENAHHFSKRTLKGVFLHVKKIAKTDEKTIKLMFGKNLKYL